jgi:hypothetical protein
MQTQNHLLCKPKNHPSTKPIKNHQRPKPFKIKTKTHFCKHPKPINQFQNQPAWKLFANNHKELMEDPSNKRPIFIGRNPQAEIGAKTPGQDRRKNPRPRTEKQWVPVGF